MNFLTHVLISRTIYRKLSKKMVLDRKAFCYGNIKPDLSPQCLRNPHILENYLFIIQNDSNRMLDLVRNAADYSNKEFSTDLGVICHYICDFFCYCHISQELYHKLLRHFLYEIRLHLTFCRLLANRQFLPKDPQNDPARSIASMVMEMRKEYSAKQKTPRRDLDFAVLASLRACELINQRFKTAVEAAEAVGS